MPHRIIATHTPFVIIRALPSMKKLGLPLFVAFVLCLAAPALPAQSDDPSETFLKAYMTSQQGEKLEHENQFKAALAKYRFAGTLLEQLRKAHSDWQPAIVEYRGRKVSESILRVQDKASTQENVSAPAENVAAAPRDSQPPLQVAKEAAAPPPAARPAPSSTPNEVVLEQATSKLRDRVDQLEGELQKSRTQMSVAENEKRSLNSRLDETKSKLDNAQGDLEKAKTAEKQVRDQLTQAQTSLKKTAAAGSNDSKAQEALKSEIVQLKKALADVKKQIGDLQAQLAASQKQNQTYETTVAQLRSQLDEASKQLEQVKLVGATPEETAKLTKENEMLRNIIVRERQEEARRDQAKKLMLAEFEKLQIKSETLTQQIQLLAQPVTRLTTDELSLLRQPVVSMSDDNGRAVKASFTFAKNTSSAPGASAPTPPGAEKSMSTDNPPQPSSSGYTIPAMFKPNVPPDVVDLAWQAKESFDKGKYKSAEKIYQEMLTKSPNNLYSLSNLGVVYFRTGKLKAAELTLKKAVALSPKDEFAHTTLGIVYYRQSKFDDALNELTKSLAINPKSAAAHNYLGITASQKGWQEAAEKEMLEAVAVKPDYADAHFNLAVIYGTASRRRIRVSLALDWEQDSLPRVRRRVFAD